ncbi:MAG: nucleotide-binding protein [Flavobacteriales bacterium]
MSEKVFIVHGRDHQALAELSKFVRSLGLEVLPFEHVANDKGGNPFVADVVSEGIQQAELVLVLFTPDELAALYDPVSGNLARNERSGSRWQARPNVIFEAGIAFAMKRERTALLTLGADVELFSDVSGMHFVNLANPGAKQHLRHRMEKMLDRELKVKPNWNSGQVSGDFKGCLRQRWSYYDELFELEETLEHERVEYDSPSLLSMLKALVLEGEGSNWDKVTSKNLMSLLGKVADKGLVDWAYWTLIRHGFLQFNNIDQFYDEDGENWRKSVDYSELSLRGKRLLLKLAITERSRPAKRGIQRKASSTKPSKATQSNVWQRHTGLSVSSSVLLQTEGAFSVWAVVSEEHFRIGERRYRYVASHCTNTHVGSGDRTREKYENAWAIVRITPSLKHPQGSWAFFGAMVYSKGA